MDVFGSGSGSGSGGVGGSGVGGSGAGGSGGEEAEERFAASCHEVLLVTMLSFGVHTDTMVDLLSRPLVRLAARKYYRAVSFDDLAIEARKVR